MAGERPNRTDALLLLRTIHVLRGMQAGLRKRDHNMRSNPAAVDVSTGVIEDVDMEGLP